MSLIVNRKRNEVKYMSDNKMDFLEAVLIVKTKLLSPILLQHSKQLYPDWMTR